MASIQESKNIKVKSWLNRYMYAKREVRRLEQEFEELIESQEGVKGVSYDGIKVMAGGDNNADLANMMVSRDANLTRIIKARSRLEEVRNEISDMIERLPDTDMRSVIAHRYILLDGFVQRKWEEICVMTDLSWATVHRTHSNALKTIAELLGY